MMHMQAPGGATLGALAKGKDLRLCPDVMEENISLFMIDMMWEVILCQLSKRD